MITQVAPADSTSIARAAAILRAGGLVAFPTETVYGLGANALDDRAVAGIFAAKGRPSSNPLIVHVPSVDEAKKWAATWPDAAQHLAERFWPGPLTLVVPAGPRISHLVTAGGSTVALRVPAHPTALALLAAAGLPVAAPSANRSSGLSSTRAEHVLAGLDGRIDMVLDAGQTPGGVESTVLDVTVSPPQLLRPGLVTPREIEAVIGPIGRQSPATAGAALRSPGMLARHYAPRTPLECAADDGFQRVLQLTKDGLRVGWMTLGEAPNALDPAKAVVLAMPIDPVAYAAQLFAALHTLDVAGVQRIVVALPPPLEEWLTVRDRLTRAGIV